MNIPPHIPAPWFSKAQNKHDQMVTRVVSFSGNVNSLAAAICLLLALKCWPTSLFDILWWLQAAGMALLLYCAVRYALRAYEAYLEDYTGRCSFVDANDTSKTIQGADSGIDGLRELKAAGMIGNANERILGVENGVPINSPSGTTFCKVVSKQGAGKTTGYATINTIHMANTVAHFTAEDDHEPVEIESNDGSDWEDQIDLEELAAFDAAQTQPENFDEFQLEGEVFRDQD